MGSLAEWESMPWQEIKPMDQRLEFALRAQRCESLRALCREYGISARAGYKWKQRLLEEGSWRLAEKVGGRTAVRPDQARPKHAGWWRCAVVIRTGAHASWPIFTAGPMARRRVRAPSSAFWNAAGRRARAVNAGPVRAGNSVVIRWLRLAMTSGRWTSKAGGMMPKVAASL